MKSKNCKRFISIAMVFTLFLSINVCVYAKDDLVSDVSLDLLVKTLDFSSEETDYHDIYPGGNISAQDYTVRSETINSYLHLCDDGNLMKFEAPEYSSYSYLVEYYDQKYNLLSSKHIAEELPMFGGFYASKNNYYLVTGQENPNESDELEVIRITKYDKNWKRISSSALRKADTYCPFKSGCLRFEEYDNILYIRTSHQMYDHGGGIRHQSNFTILYNMQTGEMEKYVFGKNDPFGYVSHSFNQFIKRDNDCIITVDHGDGYPRDVVLYKKITGRTLSVSVLSIPGEIGQNQTGVTVGGLEVSDSAYLVAGSKVNDLNNYIEYYSTKNVFLGIVSKDLKNVTVKNITNYTDDEMGVSTPHLVKIGSNRFLLLFQRRKTGYISISDSVCYLELDGNGNQIGKIHEAYGTLSDCRPVVVGQKLIWYTWYGCGTTFYEIDINNLSNFRCQLLVNGTKYSFKHLQEKGKMIKSDYLGSTVRYSLYDNGNLYIYGWGKIEDVDSQLKNNTQIKNVIIEPLVTSMAESIFTGNTEMQSVSLPESFRSIGKNYFSCCFGLKSVTIPNSVTSIDSAAFYGCTSLTSITIPNSVTSIGDYAFIYCDSLTSINVSEDNIHFTSVNGVLFDKAKNRLIVCPGGKKGSITIPNSVTSIGEGAFYYCDGLTSITIPNSVTSIGCYAFSGCSNLKDIYYTGTQKQWDNMLTDENGDKINVGLNSFVTIHYNSVETPISIISHPENVAVKINASVSFSVIAQGEGLTYQWYYKKSDQAAWNKWEGKTSDTITATSNSTWNGMLVYCKVTDKYGNTQNSNTATITVSSDPEERLFGDINGDGKVNGKDATRLMQYLAGWDVEIDQSAADVNGDGKINGKDATRMMQYLAGWDVTLG